MWHVLPGERHIGKCFFKKREYCKFYQQDKNTEHFETYDEALFFQQDKLIEENKLLPPDIQFEIDAENKFSRHGKLDLLRESERMEIAETTNDDSILRDIFNKKLFLTDDARYIEVALRNQHFPEDLRNELVKNPDIYVEDRIYTLVGSGTLSGRQLLDIIKNSLNHDLVDFVYNIYLVEQQY